MKRHVLTEPHPHLRLVSDPVPAVDSTILALVDDMFETMYAEQGIGLAAPQIDVRQRVVVIDISDTHQMGGAEGIISAGTFTMINPEILWSSDQTRSMMEGCLSVRNCQASVTRPDQVRVRFLDKQGEAQELLAGGLLATCIQHEIDHLNGVLFFDHLPALKRKQIVQKLAEAQNRNPETSPAA